MIVIVHSCARQQYQYSAKNPAVYNQEFCLSRMRYGTEKTRDEIVGPAVCASCRILPDVAVVFEHLSCTGYRWCREKRCGLFGEGEAGRREEGKHSAGKHNAGKHNAGKYSAGKYSADKYNADKYKASPEQARIGPTRCCPWAIYSAVGCG